MTARPETNPEKAKDDDVAELERKLTEMDSGLDLKRKAVEDALEEGETEVARFVEQCQRPGTAKRLRNDIVEKAPGGSKERPKPGGVRRVLGALARPVTALGAALTGSNGNGAEEEKPEAPKESPGEEKEREADAET